MKTIRNRLNLDFTLQTTDERSNFIQNYVSQEWDPPLTSDELSTIADYLLWGKDPKTGLNARQTKKIIMTTKHGTWDHTKQFDSLEELQSEAGFDEGSVRDAYNSTPYRIPKQTFSREEALTEAPSELRQQFIDLFAAIDELDTCLLIWEHLHGRNLEKPLPPQYDDTQIAEFSERVSHWGQPRYLTMRHSLVDLRRQQYSLRDLYKEPIRIFKAIGGQPPPEPDFEAGIPVLPLGTRRSNSPIIW